MGSDSKTASSTVDHATADAVANAALSKELAGSREGSDLGEPHAADAQMTRDQIELSRIGKKAVLKRNFGFMSILGFSCIVLDTWEGAFLSFQLGFDNGGPAGLIYGFIIAWIGTLCIFCTLGELASMAPTAGGQYHWVAILAPPNYARLFSYITGWLTVCGWQATLASITYLSGTLVQGFIQVVNTSYEPKLWHGTLLFFAVLLLCIFFNTVISSALPKVEIFILVLYFLGYIGIMVPLVYLGPHGDASSVFTTFLNEGHWPTQGLSFFIGLAGSAFAFLGADSAIHMSEEIKNASTVVPQSILFSLLLNGVLGFGMLVAVLFCIGDVDAAIKTDFQYPFIEIFIQATNSYGGSAVMVVIVLVIAISTSIGVLASASRMLWSFSRDRGVPGWRHISKVDRKSSIPMTSIIVTGTFNCLLALISIGSPAAFNDVISLTINGLYSSYFAACALLLWRRCTGAIKSPSADNEAHANTFNGKDSTRSTQLVWGPWRMPEKLGIAVNTFACIWMIIVLFFSFWPAETPVTPASMNYSSLVTGAVAIFSTVYYLTSARNVYNGPIVEV